MSKEANEENVNFDIEISHEMKRAIDLLIVEGGFTDYDELFISLVQDELEKRRASNSHS